MFIILVIFVAWFCLDSKKKKKKKRLTRLFIYLMAPDLDQDIFPVNFFKFNQSLKEKCNINVV
jgi:hypothetical protein